MRTQQDTPILAANGKWAVVLHTYAGTPGNEHLIAVTASAGLFDTEEETYLASIRAMNVLEETGKLPDLTEWF